MDNDLKRLVNENEKILYEGRPNKKCFIFESIFNPLLPFALIWAIIDIGFFGRAMLASEDVSLLSFVIPFMLLHMMPVWIYLGGVLLTIRRYKNTNYVVTDRAIYVSGGTFAKTFNNKSFGELSHINLHRGIFDQWFGVGDVIATSAQNSVGGPAVISINSISNYDEVYKMIKKVQTDIYTDIMYPNDKRPKENHGYNTEYKG